MFRNSDKSCVVLSFYGVVHIVFLYDNDCTK
jgi:hypothetical protein